MSRSTGTETRTQYSSVPTSVVIPAGLSTTTFDISAVDDTLYDGTQLVTITASAAGFDDATDSLDVTDNEIPSLLLMINDDSIAENAGVGASTGTLLRFADTCGALTVNLASSDISEVTLPQSVVFTAGSSTTTFDINAVDDTAVDGTQTVTITATADGFTDGSDSLDVTDDDLPALTLSIAAESIMENAGSPATVATVTRNTDTTDALTVTLASSDTTEAVVPLTVEIPAGATSVSFDIGAVDDDLVDGNQSVTISASAIGYESGVGWLAVLDDEGREDRRMLQFLLLLID